LEFKEVSSRVLQLAKINDDISALWLYGSHAKGNSSEFSDIDLAVLFSQDEKDILTCRLRPELLALEWCQQLELAEGKLSILDIEKAAIPLAMGVLQTGVLLLNKFPDKEYRVTGSIMSKWELDYAYHYKNLG